jgi:phage FluMu protein Com
MNIKTLVTAASLLLAVSLFQGCATSASFGEAKTAVVCPQCKMVETVTYLPAGPSFSRAGVSAYGVADLGYPTSVHKHTCPGCQGMLTSFAREGKWQHKCSICKQHAFSCPVLHPTE